MAARSETDVVAFLFDLDGTLIDSVDQHGLNWSGPVLIECTKSAYLLRHLDEVVLRLASDGR